MNYENETTTLQQLKFQNDGLLQSGYLDSTTLIDFVQVSSHHFKRLLMEDIAKVVDNNDILECFQPPVEFTELIDQYWLDFQRPTVKYFDAQLKRLVHDRIRRTTSEHSGIIRKSRGRKRVVEVRKIFNLYIKCNRMFCQFHIQLIKELLGAYKLDEIGPVDCVSKLLSISDLNEGNFRDIKGMAVCSQLLYVIHRCLSYLGNLSRYRTLLATKYASPSGLSGQDKKNYGKSLEYLNLAILLLPSQGDPYNYIGLTEKLRHDNLSTVYNFTRSTMTRIYSPTGFGNLIQYLTSEVLYSTVSKAIIEFRKCNITGGSKLVACNTYFIAVFGAHFLSGKWDAPQDMASNNISLNSIQDNYWDSIASLEIHKPSHFKILWKQAIILISGHTILSNPNFNHEMLDKSEKLVRNYLRFVFLFIDQILNNFTFSSTINEKVLPIIRLFLCWTKQGGAPLHYLMSQSSAISNLVHFCEVSSLLVNKEELCIAKPLREYYFHEDVDLKEFIPIGCRFKDFNDTWILDKSQDGYKRLIGERPKNILTNDVKSDEDVLRIKAVSYMVDQLLKYKMKTESGS